MKSAVELLVQSLPLSLAELLQPEAVSKLYNGICESILIVCPKFLEFRPAEAGSVDCFSGRERSAHI